MKKVFYSITKKEWIFFGVVSFFILLLSNFSFLHAILNTPDNFVFNGLHAQSPTDIAVYYSYINQVQDGNFFLKDAFTSETQASGIFNIVWFLTGIASRVLQLSDITTFHLARMALSPLLLFGLFFLTAFFFKKTKDRVIAFLLIVGSGIGSFFVLFLPHTEYLNHGANYLWPVDLWAITHAYVVTTLSQSPHIIVSWLLQIGALFFGYLGISSRKIVYSIIAGVCALTLFNFHPYHAPGVYLTLGIFIFFLFLKNCTHHKRWSNSTIVLFDHLLKHELPTLFRSIFYLGIIVVISFPSIFYHIWVLKNNEILSVRGLQNITLLPPFIFTFLGYGFLFVLAVLGIGAMLYRRDFSRRKLFVVSWFFATFLLVLVQTPFQAKFLQAWIVPMALLSTYFLQYLYDLIKKRKPNIRPKIMIIVAIIFYVVFIFFSNIVNVVRDYVYVEQYADSFYFSDDFMEGIDWIDKNVNINEVILSSIHGGLFISGFTAKTVYLGHGHETLYKDAKEKYVDDFFTAFSQDERQAFLQKANIDYIFVGKFEQKYPLSWIDEADYLELVFANDEVKIFNYAFE